MTAEVLTFGCRLNAYESAVIRDLAGYAAVDGSAAGQPGTVPDTVVVNTCAVTVEAERQCRKAIRRLHRDRPGVRIVATGCAVQLDPAAWAALPPDGRIVANAVTVESEAALIAARARFGGTLSRLSVERLDRIGGLHGYRPAITVTQWLAEKA